VQGGKDPGPGSDLDLAAIYSKLGNKERALDLLEHAFTERDMRLMNLKVGPRFDNLRFWTASTKACLLRVSPESPTTCR
jgi:hypothetical protein